MDVRIDKANEIQPRLPLRLLVLCRSHQGTRDHVLSMERLMAGSMAGLRWPCLLCHLWRRKQSGRVENLRFYKLRSRNTTTGFIHYMIYAFSNVEGRRKNRCIAILFLRALLFVRKFTSGTGTRGMKWKADKS